MAETQPPEPRRSREEILATVRAHQPLASELPTLDRQWITYPDRPAQFAKVLSEIGGQFVRVSYAAAAHVALGEIPAYRDAKQFISLVPGIGTSNVDLTAISDPHALEPIDFAILSGNFGVAENAAIWVTDRNLPLRALFFIVQHLALVLPAGQIVDNMHQAYERIKFDRAEFGAFIAGPSKTADIEQSLVIGAHGPRSLTVFCIG
ncbi:MAG TPA: LUD domain-containing protein [Pirellulales bacterium]|nr:LUD domain-containing protein [Pirellulales bacterium]